MRLWSLHPKYLDCKGLVALWREGLLALNVLKGNTKGYKNHPQLLRFKVTKDPVLSIKSYLYVVYCEAKNRGYNFDLSKLDNLSGEIENIPVTKGQVEYEFEHLRKKVLTRTNKNLNCDNIKVHELFYVVDGDIEKWEII